MHTHEVLTSNIIDSNSLKEYFANDKGILIQLIGVYLSDTAPRITILEESITTIKYESVKNICNFLKSYFELMDLKYLDEIAELEEQDQKKEVKKL